MDNIKEKIKEINDYFVNKIINGEYIVELIDKFVVVINVDGYIFTLWAANSHENFKPYSGMMNFMMIDFTEEQAKYLYHGFNKMITDMEETKELEQYNNLKNKYDGK